ncbi:Nucleolar complex protein 2 [Podosphaera aphanis]|nr:Nucleolar complex protein 2 [Podosphaera aphanis]
MAKNTKKSTRKFEKNQLKDTIEKRKAVAKIKQRQQVKVKRQARKAESPENPQNEEDNDTSKEDRFDEMNVDSFFQGGFKIPTEVKKAKTKSSEKQLGKRKRTKTDSDGDNLSDTKAQYSSDGEDDDKIEEDIGMSKDTMNELAVKDPEFYKFLKENDPETLDFDENMDLAEVDDLSASEQEEKPRKKRKKSKASTDDEGSGEESSSSEVTKAMITKWTKAMTEQNSLRAMRQVVLAFRAAAHINEDNGNEHKYTISSPEAYHELLITALKNIPLVLHHHLPIKESQSGKVRVSTESKKFKTLTPLLKSHSTSVQHLLTTLSDASTLKITLSSITPLLPYLISFKKLLKNIIKTIVDIWSDASNSEATRITAFLVIRRLAVIGDPGLREAVLKSVYQGLVKGSRSTTIHTIQGINLMKNSAAELWGIDLSVGYATGFSYIRQLAIHLRNSITNNQKESYKTVYNWQYVHSLDFWSCVLSEHCSPLKEAEMGQQSELRPLIYPTVQITLGALRLIPTATYFPLRFHLLRSLLRLSRATGTYIPLASPILEVLNFNEMRKASKASTLKPFDFSTNYKAQKSYLRTRVYQDGVGEQVVELLAEFFVLWSTSIAFPELALPVVVMLKRWLKEVCSKEKGNKNGKVSNMVSLLIQKIDMNSKWIEGKRATVEFAPNNRAGVDNFLKGHDWETTPLGAFVAGQRKQREEKAKLIEEGRREEERKRKADKKPVKESNTVTVNDDSDSSEANLIGSEEECK